MVYTMPLINDLLEDLESTLWYCSLDMASGFWVIYERMIDNALYGFTRILKMAGDLKHLDVFEAGEPEDPGKPSVLGRRSYIDDILVPADNWDQLCDRVEDLLEACDKWNLSISVVKRFWGMPKVEYLGHKVLLDGPEANPKDLSALTDFEFPGSLPSELYELREIDYASTEKGMNRSRIQLEPASESSDPDILTEDPTSPQPSDPSLRGQDPGFSDQDPNLASRDSTPNCVKTTNPKNDNPADLDPRWIHGHRSFKVLKEKIAKTPILRHFDPDRQAVVVVYASDWAISGALMQEYDQVYYPVMFASRTLKSNELNYGIDEKEVLALFRILDLNYNTLVGRPIRVLIRHSTVAWLFRFNALQGRLEQWSPLLSPWTLEIVKCNKGEDEILGTLAASITPRSEVDKALISIASKKEPRRKTQAPIPTVRSDEDLYVDSFDGSARDKRGGDAYSAILWKLPEWTVVKARSGYAEGLTVNEAGYHGLLLCLDLLEGTDPLRLVICGDSNLVISQVRGEIVCKAPGLTLLRQKALNRLRIRPDLELVHGNGIGTEEQIVCLVLHCNGSAGSKSKLIARFRI
ncbi:reverse transcriptase [Phytophthora megakarya]|uniref:Reverse transcriptase n=1 Tax=Phytophthora megakarya TaxID=4795 RepID=A0A225VG03_9STRA|nr:reverse transcriptase [Phytophthora megakarya]